ncbi:MAG: alkaline phosphatase family protein [candidate division WOR-3 bacterium]
MKIFVIGIDGGSFDLIEKFLKEDKLKNLKKFFEKGFIGEIESTYPSISACAWTSFLTSKNPGAHGVFDFRNLNIKLYEMREAEIIHSGFFKGITFLDYFNEKGLNVGAITIPITYPPWKIKDFLVSGFPTPDTKEVFAYPSELKKEIEPLTENTSIFKGGSEKRVFDELIRLLEIRKKAGIYLYKKYKPFFFIIVLGSADRAQHNFYKYIEEKDNYIEKVYIKTDEVIGEFLKILDEDTLVFIMSDHGARKRPLKKFNLNFFLKERGFLKEKKTKSLYEPFKEIYRKLKGKFPYQEIVFKKLPLNLRKILTKIDTFSETSLFNIDFNKTKAYRFPLYPPVDGIVINLKERQPKGIVKAEDYEKVRIKIKEELEEFSINGIKPIQKVFLREELYKGKYSEKLPDLILIYSDDFEGGSSLNEYISEIDKKDYEKLNGIHSTKGIFFGMGKILKEKYKIKGKYTLLDLAPTFLFLSGLPVPEEFEGKVIEEIVKEEYLSKIKLKREKWGKELIFEEHIFIDKEKKEIEEKLKGWGYM